MFVIEELEKLARWYKSYFGIYVSLFALIMLALTIYWFDTYSLAGIDKKKYIPTLLIWLVIGSLIKALLTIFTQIKNKQKGKQSND